jgi:hypothetical protein
VTGGSNRPAALIRLCRSVANIVKAYAGRAGFDAAIFSAHSLRSGFLTSAAAKGASMQAIREIADRLDGKPKQEAEVTLRNAVASELSDDDLAAIAAGAKDEEIESNPRPDSSKLN